MMANLFTGLSYDGGRFRYSTSVSYSGPEGVAALITLNQVTYAVKLRRNYDNRLEAAVYRVASSTDYRYIRTVNPAFYSINDIVRSALP